ncbi:BadM/Rrf2 family transcriptional regulator [Prosthecobacter fusiformis]|uniref:BadM/Rrf2 family transcriptional regulator n=1 Tax=Prosthecobacter fusiformis TaxID=48464 RepID=A0A4R7SSI0_9BACT|nr:Rrf2 family transcriptional regulator [Prosthecobacter fusiformis]TDU81138.1 BadM/Rrf2 family transcriptional regulator [Prosthecobacter fusiformis]
MRLSLFSDYSLRVLLFGAVKGGPFPLHEVAAAYNISRHHLVKVVNNLTKQGYLATRRGRGGGIVLAMKPEEIQIGRLVRGTETSSPLVECFDLKTNTCPIHSCCGLKSAMAQAIGAFYGTLDRYTLQDMLGAQRIDTLKEILLAPTKRVTLLHADEDVADYDKTSPITDPLSPMVNGRLLGDMTI